MAATDWNAFTDQTNARMAALRKEMPDVAPAFGSLAKAAIAPGELDSKTKELIALAISVAVRCEDCIGFHAKAAAERGATREEVMEALGMAIYMGAGPSVMYASHAAEAFDQLSQNKEP